MLQKTIVIFSAIILIGCGRKEPVPQQEEGLKVDVLGFASTRTTSNGIPTIWTADGGSNTTFIPLNHDKIALSGAHELQTGGGRNLVYFGTELIAGTARIVLFTYEGKKVLSEEVGLTLMTDRQEHLYAHHTDGQGNLYLHSICQTTGYRSISYVYKIDNLLGIEKLDMPVDTPFALFSTPNGLISVKATYLPSSIEVSLGHQFRGIEKIRVDLTGYSEQYVHSAYRNHMGRLVLVVSVIWKEDKKPAYLLVSIDPETGKVIRHALMLPKENYQFGRGIMEGNVLFVPGWERSTNRTFYLRIDTQTDLPELSVTRTELETDPQLRITQALFLQRLNGDIYVGGVQFGRGCYWKDRKLIRLQSEPSIIRSYPIQFLAH